MRVAWKGSPLSLVPAHLSTGRGAGSVKRAPPAIVHAYLFFFHGIQLLCSGLYNSKVAQLHAHRYAPICNSIIFSLCSVSIYVFECSLTQSIHHSQPLICLFDPLNKDQIYTTLIYLSQLPEHASGNFCATRPH